MFNYPIHIWTEEEILKLEEVRFNKNELLPFDEIKRKVQTGERLDLPSLFEEETFSDIYFYGLVQTKNGVYLCNIIPGVGFIEINVDENITDDNISEHNLSSLILYDLLMVNPEWYNIRKETSKDTNSDQEVKVLKVFNMVKKLDPGKHPYGDA